MYYPHPHMVIDQYAKYDMTMSKFKLQVGHEDMTKAHKFDLKVKVQGRIWIMNVRDSSSYGDTPMCQIW